MEHVFGAATQQNVGQLVEQVFHTYYKQETVRSA